MIADRINNECSDIDNATDKIKDLISDAIEEMHHQKLDSGIIGNLTDAKGDLKKIESASNSIRHLADDVESLEDEADEEPEPCECENYDYFKGTDKITYHCASNWDKDLMQVIEQLFFNGLTAQQITNHLLTLKQ